MYFTFLSSLLHAYIKVIKTTAKGTSTFHTILNMKHSKQILTYTSITAAVIIHILLSASLNSLKHLKETRSQQFVTEIISV